MTECWNVVIVGSGHAGANAAASLRQRGFAGTIAIIGAEADLPYERPPLSKEYLAGEKSFERIMIRPRSFWAERDIDLVLATEVTGVDPAAREVSLSDGRTVAYRHLIWAAGGVPRRLACSGHDLVGVHTIRTRVDVDSLVAELPAVRRVVVIGGGYIGLEAASALTKFGKHVTVVEALDRVLARVAGEPLSRFYEAEHRVHGVDLYLGAGVVCIEGKRGAVSGVRLETGEVLACEMVIVGIGIVPAVQPLLAAGADGQNGVTVDDQCRTTLPDIFAIGDCAAHVNAYADGATIRLESVQNAHDQASVVAQLLTGAPARYAAVPWFWSNQYDLRLQTVGLSIGFDQTVVRGDPALRSFSVVYLRGGKVIALDCVNTVKDYVQGKALVERGLIVAPARLADTSVPLKELAQAFHARST